ncbi:hypothetical protein QYF61_012324 [Mycteria americana]|uniref:Uncharacterized protein n=1 Tax=Mycteria americana TaxID=33587 RepID=A0AAN7S4U7_MYCAM|nr:hypothetical protein QYF61_012324 [Mycteria americana]
MRLLRAPSNLTLNVSRDGASTTSLGNLVQCFTTLIVKNFFLISSLNLPSCSLKPLPLVLSQQARLKILKGHNKVSLEPSFLQAEQPQLSQPVLIGEVLQPSDHFCGPPLDLLQQVHVFPVLRAPELDTALQPPVPPSPSWQGCSQSLHPPACIDTGGFPQARCRTLHLALLNLMRFTRAHFSSLSRSLWMASCPSGMSTVPLSLVLSANLLRVHSIPLPMSLMKILNSIGPTIDRYPLDATIQTIPHPPNSPPIKSVSLQFREKDVVGAHVKGLTEVQIDDILGGTLLPQSPYCGPSTREVWEERLPVKTEAKNLLSTSAFSSSIVTSLPVLLIRGKTFLLFFASLAKFSSSCALAFLTPSLHNCAASLYSSQDLSPCFCCLCISFLPFSLTSRSQVIHASLLPSFPDFLHLGIESSCTLWKASLKICQLCSVPLSLRAVSQGGPDFTLRLTHIAQDCELHQYMIAAAQAASNLDITN